MEAEAIDAAKAAAELNIMGGLASVTDACLRPARRRCGAGLPRTTGRDEATGADIASPRDANRT